MMANPAMTRERMEQLRQQFGNNTPLLQQYWHWLSSALHGDLQWSRFNNEPVTKLIGGALPYTLLLMGLAYPAGVLGGVALGAWQAMHSGTRLGRASTAMTFTIFSLPDFWIAILLQLIFVAKLRLFPAGGAFGYESGLSLPAQIMSKAHYVALPWLSLVLVDVAVFARFQRAAMRDVAGQQFLRTARAKGVSERVVNWKHALRVSVLPMITLAGMYFPALFVGAILVETVFGWPGVGSLLSRAIAERDYFLVAGIVVVGSTMTALGNALADTAREFADPRLRS